MRFTTSLALLLSVAFADAQFTKPLAGDTFPLGQQITIEWYTAGLKAPINLDLVPGDATDGSVVAETIGAQIENVGRLNWTPDASITAFGNFMMKITDSNQAVVFSQPFQISQLTQQPVVQTVVGDQVQVLAMPAAPPKTVYSGELPPEATPAGLVVVDTAPPAALRGNATAPETPVEATPAQPTAAETTTAAAGGAKGRKGKDEGEGSVETPAETTPAESGATDPEAAPLKTTPAGDTTSARGRGKGRGKGKGRGRGGNGKNNGGGGGAINGTEIATAAPTTSAAAGGDDTQATPSPIFSTIDPGSEPAVPSSAPQSVPTPPPVSNQTASAAPSPIYSTIDPGSKPASPPSALPPVNNQTASAAPSPIYSTIDPGSKPAAPSSAFPTLPPVSNQTAPAVESPTEAAETTELSRISIVPTATAPASIPLVLIPPKNTSAPIESATQPALIVPANTTTAAIPPVATTAPTLVVPANTTTVDVPPVASATQPAVLVPVNSSIPAELPVISATTTAVLVPANTTTPELPAIPVTEPAAVVPVPVPAAPTETPSNVPETVETPGVVPPAVSATELPTSALPTELLPLKPSQSDPPAATTEKTPSSAESQPLQSTQPAQATQPTQPTPSTGTDDKPQESNGDKTGETGSGNGSGNNSENGSGSGSNDGSRSGGDGASSGSDASAPVTPTPNGQATAVPQLNPAVPTTVNRLQPIISLPSSMATSMVLATGVAGAAAPTGGLAFATSPPSVLLPSAGSKTTQKGCLAALIGTAAALTVTYIL
ncbi:hypothetical protein CMUS01_04900 [Colletotrichum musicola]|uniref:Yeast cell wall synthesis Kre9/Knh1-like N-terminal domain-containing protein n=1 Tax=Colletotrichum musicola TaxID=2175873 RepID=A0A8H6KUI0_9PEZI|nr:hypothetical protein CMUS01_04900 [Colletotrichum musicola]